MPWRGLLPFWKALDTMKSLNKAKSYLRLFNGNSGKAIKFLEFKIRSMKRELAQKERRLKRCF